jgi:hypothetical protein
MNKHIQFTIPEKCHENWAGMQKVQQGRFCLSCQKNVVDFTAMTDAQVLAFFKKNTGNVCGRFNADQLNRNMEIPRKTIPWVRYFFQVAIPAFLAANKVQAQGGVKEISMPMVVVQPSIKQSDEMNESRRSSKEWMIEGSVQANGGPVPFTTIQVKETGSAVSADEKGCFKIPVTGNFTKIVLVVSCIGFHSKEVEVSMNEYAGPLKINLDERDMELLGMVGAIVVVHRDPAPVPALLQVLKDTLAGRLKLFPNPARKNARVSLEWPGKEEGLFKIGLFSISGQLVYSRDIWLDKGARLIEIPIPSVPSGHYILRLADAKNNKKFVERLVID